MLEAGRVVAHDRLVGKIGEGGMGEVYRATDDRLDRDVALKVLPKALASTPDRIARFRREAQVLASLNHPHIASILPDILVTPVPIVTDEPAPSVSADSDGTHDVEGDIWVVPRAGASSW